MNLNSQIFFAMVITSFAGSVAFAIWKKFVKLLCDRDLILENRMLRMSCMLYVLPIGYVLIQTLVRGRYIARDDVWQMHFMPNRILMWLVIVLEIIWAWLMLWHIADFARKNKYWLETERCSVPEDDPAVEEEFLRIKKKLHIRRRIGLYRNCDLKSPMIAGIFRVRIVLPEREFTREQLAVIFSHELMHYRSHDVFYRICSACVGIIQCVSPYAQELSVQLRERSECECDRKTTAAMCDEFTVGEYFARILEMADPEEEPCGEEVFLMLFESQLGLERRIEYMRKLMNTKQMRWFTSLAMAVVFAVLSISTTYAAGVGLTTVHDFLYWQTVPYGVTMTEVPSEFQVGEVHYLPAEEACTTYDECVFANPELEYISPLLAENEVVNFNWSVAAKTRSRSAQYSFYFLDKITINCQAVPANQTYWVGIEDARGNIWYTEGTGAITFQLRIPTEGNYRVFVENRGSASITAGGSYYYYELHKA